MLNQVIIAGRLANDPKVVDVEGNKKRTYITVAVPRSYKNVDGTYDTDFISCTLWAGVAESTCEYCHKGDVIGVKGRLQTSSYDNEEGEKIYKMEVIAEKISFLSSKKADE